MKEMKQYRDLTHLITKKYHKPDTDSYPRLGHTTDKYDDKYIGETRIITESLHTPPEIK